MILLLPFKREKHILLSKTRLFVGGQNSWELEGVEMAIFGDYFGKSDKTIR